MVHIFDVATEVCIYVARDLSICIMSKSCAGNF